jgi:hypothetical protein
VAGLTPEQKLLAKWVSEYEDNEDGLEFEYEDGSTPSDWIAQGFLPNEVTEWRMAGVFDAESASRAIILGLSADEMAYQPTEDDIEELGLPYLSSSFGYMFANGGLSEEQFNALKEKAEM